MSNARPKKMRAPSRRAAPKPRETSTVSSKTLFVSEALADPDADALTLLFQQTQAALLESEERYQKLVSGLLTPIFVSQNDRIIFINEAAAKFLGAKSEEQLIDKPLSDFLELKSTGEQIKVARVDGATVLAKAAFLDCHYHGTPAQQIVLREIKNSSERMRQIAHVTGAIVGSLSLREQAENLAEQVRHAFGVDACVIRLLEGEELVVLASAGIARDRLKLRMPMHDGISGQTIMQRRPVFIGDVNADKKTQALAQFSSYRFVSFAGAPLLADDRIIGMIGLYSETARRDFNEADLEHLQIVANHISVSIVNERLYKEISGQKHMLETQVAERRKTEEALRKSEKELRLVWENSMEGMRLTDESGIIRMVNETFCRLVGKRREQLEGRPMSVIYLAGDGERVLKSHRERFHSRSIVPHQEKGVTLWNGKELFLEITNSFLECEGQAPLVLTMFRDITERKTAELRSAAFSTLGQRLAAARDEREVACAVLDSADELIGWDAAYAVRYFPENNVKRAIIYFDTLDRRRIEIPLEEVGPALSPRLQKVISEGGQLILREHGHEAVGFTPFGDRNRPSASILAVPIRHRGKVTGVFSVQSYTFSAYNQEDLRTLQTLADFSGGTLERIHAEQTLTEERNLLRTLIDAVPDYIYVKDTQSRHLLENIAVRRLMGASAPEETLGKTAANYFPPELAQKYHDDDRAVLQSGQPLFDREEPTIDEKGDQRWLLTTKIPFRDEQGKVAGLVGISRDITNHKLAEIRMAAFSSLANRLSAVTTMEDAARIIVQIADELLGWDCAYLHLCSPEGDSIQTILNIDVINGKRTNFTTNLRKPSERMVKAMREGGQLILREEPFESAADFAPFGDTSRPSASIMIVPVRNNENIIGVLSIQSYKKRAYDAKALEMLQGLADYCGGALERLKNEAERKRIEQRNAVLLKLARSLSSASSEEEAAQIIVDAASELFGWDACWLDSYISETDIMHSLVVIDTVEGKKVRTDSMPDLPPSVMARRVLEKGAELVLRTPENLVASGTLPFGNKNRPSASLMNVPIRNAERVIGILSVQSYTFNAFCREDLATLQALADYCGGALERIRGIKAVRESEERFRTLNEAAPVGIFQADSQGRRTYLNPRWYAISGLQAGEGLGQDWVRAVHPDDRPRVKEQWQQCVAKGEEWTCEYRFLTSQGIVRWVRGMATPTFKDGQRAGYVGTVEDITERKRVEQRNAAFSKVGQRLSMASTPRQAATVIGEIAEELFPWDAFTLDLYTSERDEYISVLNIDTVNGEKREVPHTSTDSRPTPRARRIMEHGAELILKEDSSVLLSDAIAFGSPHPSASIMLVPLREGSRIMGVMSIQSYALKAYDPDDLRTLQLLADHCSGALERIRAEEALRTSEVRFHSVWENSVDGMRLTDENGTIVAVNHAYCKLVGLPREALEGHSFTVVYDDVNGLDDFMRKYKSRFQRRSVPKIVKRRVTFRNGKEVDLENANSFVDSGGKTLLLGLFRDVTAQRQLEEELRQSQKLESIGRLAGGVAHDFNNILTVINGHAEMLLMDRDNLPIDLADSIEQIGKAAERASGLTRQLLAFGRKQIMQPKNIDLNEVVSNMTKMLQRMLGEDVSLQVGFHSNLPVIFADPTMIEQILLNLAVNSRDAMPKGGELFIKTAAQFIDDLYAQKNPEAYVGQFVSLSVRDTGCGIPAENLPKIFEPFFTTKDVGKGTGLGLATVYGIVKQHRGWITVSSTVGVGTTFEIFLPSGGSRRVDDSEAAQKMGMRGGHETILVVEDEPEVRSLALSILKKLGYHCLEARTGLDALSIWERHKAEVDLVLTDIVMPDGMSGSDLAEKLQADKEGLKVIFTSGYPKDVLGKDFVLREGVNFLQKPYYPQKLAETIRDCLDSGNIIHG